MKRIFNHCLSSAIFFLSISLGGAKGAEWQVPVAGHVLTFPKDHGSHPDFKIEWWYLTGHLFAGERRFGFQATFFRLGRDPKKDPADEDFGTSQFYLAHMGLCDPMTGAFFHEERLNRAGWNAGAKVGELDLSNGNWSLRKSGTGMLLEGSIQAEVKLSLQLEPLKGPVIFGEDGVSRKGPEGTAASYYITYPRLKTTGTVSLDGETLDVTGEAWMDHEISSSQLDRNQIGWDWTCIQFFDGREIMGFVLRTEEGKPSDYSRLVWVDRNGVLISLELGNYEWRHEGAWTSPETKATYPISPLILTSDPESGKERRFRLRPLLEAQEMVGAAGGVSYWEGACDVLDEETGKNVGRAYLEMTGYADNVGEKLR